jgi:hypothetical protein
MKDIYVIQEYEYGTDSDGLSRLCALRCVWEDEAGARGWVWDAIRESAEDNYEHEALFFFDHQHVFQELVIKEGDRYYAIKPIRLQRS